MPEGIVIGLRAAQRTGRMNSESKKIGEVDGNGVHAGRGRPLHKTEGVRLCVDRMAVERGPRLGVAATPTPRFPRLCGTPARDNPFPACAKFCLPVDAFGCIVRLALCSACNRPPCAIRGKIHEQSTTRPAVRQSYRRREPEAEAGARGGAEAQSRYWPHAEERILPPAYGPTERTPPPRTVTRGGVIPLRWGAPSLAPRPRLRLRA